MARHKDFDWDVPEGNQQPDGSRSHSWEAIKVSLLMDLRDEIKRLNALLHCRNFTGMPATLRGLRRDLAKKRRKKR